MYEDTIQFIKSIYQSKKIIRLHEPMFIGNEKNYLSDCIDSTFVSSSGDFINKIESRIARYTGVNHVVATSSGTSALHIALLISNVNKNDEVITQPLTFVATSNAISYCGAKPIFIDVDRDTMGLSPKSLSKFLDENSIIKDNKCINKVTKNIIKACIPMHSFGHPCKIDEIKEICDSHKITLIEDSAESLGSFYKGNHTGGFGKLGVLSFNGNKIITSGGGGCIITNDKELALRARHIASTAKLPHNWNYIHDEIGFNYRMPNLNAALLLAQFENLEKFIDCKRKIAIKYKNFFSRQDMKFFEEPKSCRSNYWLNAIILKDKQQRDLFLDETNSKGVMCRPIWTLMNKLTMFQHCQCGDLTNVEWLEERVVNIPSSATIS